MSIYFLCIRCAHKINTIFLLTFLCCNVSISLISVSRVLYIYCLVDNKSNDVISECMYGAPCDSRLADS